jgi:hypothetical protein
MGGPAVAIILRKERHVAEAFVSAGATSAERARAPEELAVSMHGIGWMRLVNRAILREGAPGRWYLDEPSWVATNRMRRRRTIILIVIVALVGLAVMYTQARP